MLTELLRALTADRDAASPLRRTPFSELSDAAGECLVLVLCSAPAAAYRLSYVLPYDRFKVWHGDGMLRPGCV